MNLTTSVKRTEEFNKVSAKIFYGRLLSKNPTIVDVGANKGQTIDIFTKIFPKSKIYAFEPSETYEFLKKKYKKNKNIFIYNYAISNKEKMQTLFVNKHDLTTSLSQIDKKNKYLNIKAKLFGGNIDEMILKEYKIKTVKMLKIIHLKKIKKIDVLKIDTEGHELQVLKGMESYLKKNVKCIVIEFHNSNVYLNYNASKVHQYLKNNNFILKRKFSFPFTSWEDRIYINKSV